MKKIILSVLIAFGTYTISTAQQAVADENWCGTSQKMKEFKASLSPQQLALYELQQKAIKKKYKEYTAQLKKNGENSSLERGTIRDTIPVVFHILHQGGSENISNEQVYNALEYINKDYQKSNNWANVDPYFKPIVADVQLQFVLAKKDPNGNCTNGITRTFSTETASGDGGDQLQAIKNNVGNWPGDEYLNIFVCKYIGGAAGYTYRPSGWGATAMGNGIYILSNYVGGIGSAIPNNAHALTHEIGHWLGLKHTWGGTNNPGLASNCSDDDDFADTPNTIGWTSCTVGGSTCGHPGVPDNVENFMEYSYCSKMFTEDQKDYMWYVLDNNIGNRGNVVSKSNLISTGVSTQGSICKAIFKSNDRVVCPGQSITFTDLSYHNVSSWSWEFDGGSPATSTSQNPVITYNTPGTYEVKLTVSDGSSQVSTTETQYITVLDNGVALPFAEGFESYTTIASSGFWTIENIDENGTWQVTSTASYTGNKSIKLANFGQGSGNIDAFVSEPIDLSTISSSTDATLSFRYAYRKRSSSNLENLRVKITNNCGATWQARKTIAGTSLGEKTAPNSWVPSSKDDWVTVFMTNITVQYWVDNFRVKFEFESDGGNNLYVDDINIYAGTPDDDPLASLNDNAFIQSFSVHPNPASEAANVSFTLANNQTTKIALLNMVGQEVQTTVVPASIGKNMVVLNTSELDAGVYLVTVNVGGIKKTKRLIIK